MSEAKESSKSAQNHSYRSLLTNSRVMCAAKEFQRFYLTVHTIHSKQIPGLCKKQKRSCSLLIIYRSQRFTLNKFPDYVYSKTHFNPWQFHFKRWFGGGFFFAEISGRIIMFTQEELFPVGIHSLRSVSAVMLLQLYQIFYEKWIRFFDNLITPKWNVSQNTLFKSKSLYF